MPKPTKQPKQAIVGVYRWLVGNLRLWSVHESASSKSLSDYQSIHIEAVTINREIIANHLAYM